MLDGPDIRFDSDIIQAGKMIAGDSLEGARMGNMGKIGNPVWASKSGQARQKSKKATTASPVTCYLWVERKEHAISDIRWISFTLEKVSNEE